MVLHLSQNLVSFGEYMSYLRKRISCHSCEPSSVPFTINSYTISHTTVFVTRRKQSETWPWEPAWVSARASIDRLEFLFCTSFIPSLRNMVWSAVLNSSWPLSDATRSPVTTYDAVQFSGTFSVGSRRARCACFTGRRVTPRSGIPSPTTWKRAVMKDTQSNFSTSLKASPVLGVTRCTNAHSFWGDF